eukprot:2910884-Pleurochrysis_carterae.AAC.1
MVLALRSARLTRRRARAWPAHRMRAGAHARGAQLGRGLCLRHSRRQTRRHGLERPHGARVAPRRRRA